MDKKQKVTIGRIIIYLSLAAIVVIFILYGNILKKNNSIIYKTSRLETERVQVNVLLQDVLFSQKNLFSTYSTFSSAYSELSQELIELTSLPFVNKIVLESESIQQSTNVLLNLMKVNQKRMLEIDDRIAGLKDDQIEYLPGPYSSETEHYIGDNTNLYQLAVQLESLPVNNGGPWEISFKNLIDEVNQATKNQTFFIEILSVSLILLLVSFIMILTRMFRKMYDEVNELSKNLEQQVIERSEELNKVLFELSITDELTGLYNRRHFNTIFEKGWKVCIREKKPISIIMIDIDYFKNYNDNYGHVAGDAALTSVASVIRKSLNRTVDIASRYGGEEFIIFLPNTDMDGSTCIAHKIQKGISTLALEHDKSLVSSVITVSMGVATTCPGIYDNSTDLIKRADECLYKAKEKGRDRIVAELIRTEGP